MISQIDGAAPSQVGNAVFETLENTRLLRRTIMRMIGHLWYFMTSTWGLGALALVEGRQPSGRCRRGRARPQGQEGRRHRELAQRPGRPARRPGRPRARVRDLAPRLIPAPRGTENGWTPAAPAGVHPFSVRVFHGHLTWGGPGRGKRVVRFDHSAWRGILFGPIGQVRASYGRLLKLLG